MNIGLLIPYFTTKGGIERFVLSLGNGLAERGHRCTLIHPKESHEAYTVPDSIHRIILDAFNPSRAWENSAKSLLKDADFDAICILSSSSRGRNLFSICQGLRVPIIWSEHSSPWIIEQERWNRRERLACMAGADAIHLLCRGFLQSLPPLLRKRAAVIPNFHSLVPVRKEKTATIRKRLLTVARLDESSKQLSLLLYAFANLKDEFSTWDCRICGEGPSRKLYEKLIEELNLKNRVIMTGEIENVVAEYAAADIFVFPSRYEGFGIALAEAQSFGLASIGFADCSGVNEIIVHGENGLLASEMTAESLSRELHLLMSNERLRKQMGVRAQELSVRYDKEPLLDKWEQLFLKFISRRTPIAMDMMESIGDSEIIEGIRSLRMESENKYQLKLLMSMIRSNYRSLHNHT